MNVAAKPQVVIKSDYDGYFERLVRSWLERKTEPAKHEVIEVSAGPYRAAAVTTRSDGRVMQIDFAIRAGFGSLDEHEVATIVHML